MCKFEHGPPPPKPAINTPAARREAAKAGRIAAAETALAERTAACMCRAFSWGLLLMGLSPQPPRSSLHLHMPPLACSPHRPGDPKNDPKVTSDAFKTLFVARLPYQFTEDNLREEMNRYVS